MKRLFAPLMILALSAVVWAEAPTSQPKVTHLTPEKHTASNPDLEAMLRKIPADVVHVSGEKAEEAVARGKKAREWSKANADGKTIKVTAYKWSVVGAWYFMADGTRVEIGGGGLPAKIQDLPNGTQVVVTGKIGKGGMRAMKSDEKTVYHISLEESAVER